MVMPAPFAASSTDRNRTFRPDIEGLRAIAVMLVLLDHAGLSRFSGGYVGVDVFFVLSGFLITGLLLKEARETGGISIQRFYARRARRLLPAATLVLIVTVVLSYEVFGQLRANRVAEDARWAALFASNFRSIQQGTDYLGAQQEPSPLQHFWSLAVEEQFYFVWPLLILLLASVAKGISVRLKLGVALSLMIVASVAYSVRLTAVDHTTAYFSPLPRASELAAGALLAVIAPWLLQLPRKAGVIASWAGIAVILWAAVSFDAHTVFPGSAMLIPVAGALLAVAGGTIAPGGGAEIFLKQSPMQWTGQMSYGIYLWHWPVILLAAGYAGRELSVQENLLLYVPAIVIAAVTFSMIEDPIRGAKWLRARPSFVSVGLGVALVATSFGTASAMMETHPLAAEETNARVIIEVPSTQGVLRAVAAGVDVTDWPEQPERVENGGYSDKCDVTRRDTTSNLCEFGNPDADRTVVIFGDSHAAMWIPALDRIGKANDWKVIQLTKPGCVAPDLQIWSNSLGREYAECDEWRDWAIGQIATIDPDVLLVTSAGKGIYLANGGKPTQDGLDDAWRDGLASTLDAVTPHAGRVLVIGDMAYPAKPGIDCLTENEGNASACNTSVDDAVLAGHNRIERETAEAHDAEYIDIIPWFCTQETCPAVIGGLTVHRDALHINENYAVYLSTALAEASGLTLPERIPATPQRS
jgi:peptidoglycan/LPS O-acetylase OafA/YrhL